MRYRVQRRQLKKQFHHETIHLRKKRLNRNFIYKKKSFVKRLISHWIFFLIVFSWNGLCVGTSSDAISCVQEWTQNEWTFKNERITVQILCTFHFQIHTENSVLKSTHQCPFLSVTRFWGLLPICPSIRLSIKSIRCQSASYHRHLQLGTVSCQSPVSWDQFTPRHSGETWQKKWKGYPF